MTKSKRKYINPKAFADVMTENNGSGIIIGEEKDVGEFNINFLARIDEALGKEGDNSLLSSQYINHSMKSRGFLRLSKESFVARAFFGKLLTLTYEIKDKVVRREETLFGQVMISPMAENIYQGWEANYFSEIDDFVNSKGEKTKAQQEYWILKEQKVLFLFIQRVSYDKENKKLKKVTTPVQFDEVIYIDRFMERNKRIVLKIRKHVKELKDQLNQKQELLQRYQEFGKEKQNLLTSLNTTLEFLQHQSSSDKDHYIYFAIKPSSKVANAINTLKECIACLNQKITKIESEIVEIKEKIRTAYDEMRATPYEIHSIWAHSGLPETGHYYAYIHDKMNKKWRKYDDRQVTDEHKSNIFPKNMKDTSILSSAYCLIYVKKENVESELNTRSMLIPNELSIGSYYTLLTDPLKNMVNEDNKKLEQEIAEYKDRKIASDISKEYDNSVLILQNSTRKLGTESINFVLYLYNIRNLIYRWVLLDQIVKVLKETKLEILLNNSKVIEELNKELATTRAPLHVTALNSSEVTDINSAKVKFKEVLLDWITQRYVLETIVKKDWMKALSGITFYLAQGKHTSSKNEETMKDVLKVLLLRLCSYINENLMRKNLSEVIKFIDSVSTMCVLYINKQDPHKKFIHSLFVSVFENVKKLFSDEQYKKIQEYIERINSTSLLFDIPILTEMPKVIFNNKKYRK